MEDATGSIHAKAWGCPKLASAGRLLVWLLQIDPDMKAGLWMICEAFKERNYLYAYDIYMRLAVGMHTFPTSRAFFNLICSSTAPFN